MTTQIRRIEIDLRGGVIQAYDERGLTITFPLSSTGGTIINFRSNSIGGLLIAALFKLILNVHRDGGDVV